MEAVRPLTYDKSLVNASSGSFVKRRDRRSVAVQEGRARQTAVCNYPTISWAAVFVGGLLGVLAGFILHASGLFMLQLIEKAPNLLVSFWRSRFTHSD